MLKEVEIYVVVKWDPPVFTGGTITSYEVKLITQVCSFHHMQNLCYTVTYYSDM